MRLACISTILGYPWGSPDRLWTDLAGRALARGDEVFLGLSPLTADHDAVRRLQLDGAKLFLRDGNSIYRGWREQLTRQLPWQRAKFLEGRLSQFAPDVVVLTQGATYDALAEHHLLDWLRTRGTPFVVLCHNNPADATLSPPEAQRLRDFFRLAAATRFVSTHNRELAEARLGATIPRAGLIQNPLPPGEPLPWPASTADRAVLGLIGRLDIAHKGLDLLVAAHRQLSSPRPRLVLTGRVENRTALDALLRSAGAANDVEIRAPLPADQVGQAYGELELFLLTSRYEGCASSMLEAMRAGRPILATPVGGVSDWIVDGENGYIAPEVSVDALTATLERALVDRPRWPQLGAAAHRTFVTRRDPDPVATLLATIDSLVPAAA